MMNSMPIVLTAPELQAIEGLRVRQSGLPADLLEALEEQFRQTRILLTRVAEGAHDRLYESQLALMGILNRTHELLLGGVRQITYGNRHVWGACLRGLIETFGALAWVSDNPVRLPALVQGNGINIGKLVNAAYKRLQDLKAEYKRLSSWVHPESRSLLLGLRLIEETQSLAIFAVPAPDLSADEAQAAVERLLAACWLIHQDVQALLDSYPGIIGSGKLVAQIVCRGHPPHDVC